MKNLIIVLMALFQFKSWAINGGPCDGGILGDTNINIEELLGGSCMDEKSQTKRCDCFYKAADSNILLQKPNSSYDQLLNLKKDYTARFKSSYQKIVHESQVQAMILKIPPAHPNDKQVGCTPHYIAKQVKKAEGETKKAQEELLRETIADAKIEADKFCGPGNKRNQTVERRINKCHDAEQILRRAKISMRNLELSPCRSKLALLVVEGDNSADALQIKAILSAADPLLELYKIQHGVKDLLISQIVGAKSIKNSSTYDWKRDFRSASNEDIAKMCDNFVAKVQADVKKSLLGADHDITNADPIVTNNEPTDCTFNSPEEGDASLCKGFEEMNRNQQRSVVNDYKHDPKTECVSYAEFQTFNGRPSPEFLEVLASARHPGNHLIAPFSTSDPLSEAKVRFLRANPLLASLAASSDPKVRDNLGQKLQEFAKKYKGASESQQLRGYLDCMQKDVADLYKSKPNANTTMYMCHQLANNFAAIQLANDLPAPEPKDHPTVIDEAQLCENKAFNRGATTDIRKTLSTSPLFTLGVPDQVQEHASLITAYAKFKNDHCGNAFEKFKEKNCKNSKDGSESVNPETCRQNYLAESKISDINNVVHGRTNSALSQEDRITLARSTSEKYQNHEFKNWWQQNVGSKLSNNVIASSGDRGEFAAAQAENLRTVSQAKIPESLFTPSSSATVASNPTNQTSTNSGTASPSNVASRLDEGTPSLPVPDFSQAKSPTTPIDKVIPGYQQLQNEQERKLALDNAQQALARSSQTLDPVQRTNADQIIKNEQAIVNEKIAQNKELPKNTDVITNPSGAATFTGNRSPSSTLVGPGNTIPVSGGPNVAQATISPVQKKSAEKIRNETLLQNYNAPAGTVVDDKILVNGTVPPLVLTESSKIVTGGEVDPSQLRVVNGDYGAEVVTLPAKEYNDLQAKEVGSDTALVDLLKQKFKGQKVDEQVIQINNPIPDKYLLYRLVAKGDSFALERVVVKNTYADLVNTVGNTTGTTPQRNPASKKKVK